MPNDATQTPSEGLPQTQHTTTTFTFSGPLATHRQLIDDTIFILKRIAQSENMFDTDISINESSAKVEFSFPDLKLRALNARLQKMNDGPEGDYSALGKIAYDAYGKKSDNKSLVSGADLPAWEALPKEIQDAWAASAEAVADTALLR